MRNFIDLLLVILPFEPQVLAELDGPKAVYVGHRLLSYPPLQQACAAQKERQKKHSLSMRDSSKAAPKKPEPGKKTLLLLPGSRLSEIRHLMPVFGEAVEQIQRQYSALHVILPSLPHLAEKIRALAADWPYPPHIITDEEAKWRAFAKADAALAASGTVSLELALCAVPMVLAYKADWFATKFILPQITIWSAALPNIIADEPLVPEYFNEFVRPGMLARQISRLLQPGAARQAQLQGFEKLRQIMQTEKAAGDAATEAIIAAGFIA